MASNVYLKGTLYSDVPYITVPADENGSTETTFYETSDATATASNILSGYTAYADGLITGTAEQAWFGTVDPTLLYETSYSVALSATNYADLTPSTTNQYLKHPATSYSTTAANYVIYDRYGSSDNDGESLDFGDYNYMLLNDTYVSTAYTSDESSLGIAHQNVAVNTAVIWIGQRIRSSSGSLIYPTSTKWGTTTALSYTLSGCAYRNASNTFVFAVTSAYGVGTGVVLPTFQSTSRLVSTYINFRSPYFLIRTHSSYMNANAWEYVDADNTMLYNRQRLYRVAKPNVYEQGYNRLGYMIENLAFPTE